MRKAALLFSTIGLCLAAMAVTASSTCQSGKVQRSLSISSARAMSETPPFYADKFDLLTYLDAAGAKHPIRTPADWRKRRGHILANIQVVMGPFPSKAKRVPLDVHVLQP